MIGSGHIQPKVSVGMTEHWEHASVRLSTLAAAKAISGVPRPSPKPLYLFGNDRNSAGRAEVRERNWDLKGNVARIEREDSQTVDANPHPAHTKSVFSFDEQGRLVKSVQEESLAIPTTTNLWSSRRQLESQTVPIWIATERLKSEEEQLVGMDCKTVGWR